MRGFYPHRYDHLSTKMDEDVDPTKIKKLADAAQRWLWVGFILVPIAVLVGLMVLSK